jgi:RHS repeat-associated protein
MYYMPETGLFYNYFRDYDPQTGRYLESDPIGLGGGSPSTYAYAGGNPVSNIDPLGLATVVIVGGPTPGNPLGHVAIATTGSGIYSYGTGTVEGSDVSAYLLKQAGYRDSTAYIINTTPDQEAAILAQLQGYTDNLPKVPSVNSSDTCASRTNSALRQGNMVDPSNPYAPFFNSPLPESSASIASFYSRITGGSVINIPMNSISIPAILTQFNPH